MIVFELSIIFAVYFVHFLLFLLIDLFNSICYIVDIKIKWLLLVMQARPRKEYVRRRIFLVVFLCPKTGR